MIKRIFYIILLILHVLIIPELVATGDWPVLKGPYLGQKPPGMTPEIFAPGIVSSGCHDLDITITPDGKEIFFTRSGLDWYSAVLFMKNTAGGWQGPKVLSFKEFENFNYPFVSPDGRYLLFEARKSSSKDSPPNSDIYISKRTSIGWSEPLKLDNGINTEYNEMYISMASSGNLYFSANYPESRGRFDIYRFSPNDQFHHKLVQLDSCINSDSEEFHVYVAPNESYLIFDSPRPGGFGQNDLYISYSKSDGTWTEAINMGSGINTPFGDMRPFVSFDGKYLFFCSNRPNPQYISKDNPIDYEQFMKRIEGPGNGSQDIYWVDAGIIEKLKPEDL